MKIFAPRPLLAALVLSACASQTVGPVGAPVPTHPDMTFVDLDGCSWWVIGNATSYSWAKHTNSKGEQVCSDDPAFVREKNPGVPFVTEDSAELKQVPVTASTRMVQVATFANGDNARATADRLADLGLPVRPSSRSAGRSGFYRLVLGPFEDATAAQAALSQARSEGFSDAFLYSR